MIDPSREDAVSRAVLRDVLAAIRAADDGEVAALNVAFRAAEDGSLSPHLAIVFHRLSRLAVDDVRRRARETAELRRAVQGQPRYVEDGWTATASPPNLDRDRVLLDGDSCDAPVDDTTPPPSG